jgi:hypothetical protein
LFKKNWLLVLKHPLILKIVPKATSESMDARKIRENLRFTENFGNNYQAFRTIVRAIRDYPKAGIIKN